MSDLVIGPDMHRGSHVTLFETSKCDYLGNTRLIKRVTVVRSSFKQKIASGEFHLSGHSSLRLPIQS